jgi:predicted nucleotidyltransferase
VSVDQHAGQGLEDPRLIDAVGRLVNALHPECIYLFGSRARGDADADSDFDLLVIVSESDEPRLRRAQRAREHLRGVGVPLDVLVWTRGEFDALVPVVASLPATVLREGRLLYAA